MSKRFIKWIKNKIEVVKSIYRICPICHEENDINSEFAHVKDTDINGRGRGRIERKYDVLKNVDCYRFMHKECHIYYDNVLRE